MILPLKQVPFQKKAYTFKKRRILSKKDVYFQKKTYTFKKRHTFKKRRILSKKGVYFQTKTYFQNKALSKKASHFQKSVTRQKNVFRPASCIFRRPNSQPRPNSRTQRLIEGILSLGTGQDIVIAPGQPLPFWETSTSKMKCRDAIDAMTYDRKM